MGGFGAAFVAMLGRLQKEGARGGLFALLEHDKLLGQQGMVGLLCRAGAVGAHLDVPQDGEPAGQSRGEQYESKPERDKPFQTKPLHDG